MQFEEQYSNFLNAHQAARNGERLRRLTEGHANAEMMFLKNVWWPLFRNFQHLHPEYEISDFKDGTRYLDFAYIRHGIKICIEVDGFGPHLKNITRWQFTDQLERQNQLVIDGWFVLRFSYDQITDKPRQSQQTIQQLIGKLFGDELSHLPLNYLEKEVIRFALKKDDVMTHTELCTLLDLSYKPVKKILLKLIQKGVLHPVSGKQRVHYYRLDEAVKSPYFQS
ncbi:DNA-binding response regulator [Ammoniphilus sp. CFH 90114]|uniref:DNA-binding response regulator n=1 Tax=Ammoniphilus sp. CFH 90114 TaxID=2493665 RepID=UPI00100FA1ED|nr:DNA-binding response regulator [Ammoniphilus sp. CFH 90114]RXT02360.1 DNA-binding response regulator [Ammoniphilus sp. CFH 90114]